MIAIVKACGRNFASVQFALERLGADADLTNDPKKIQQASHIIMPGVGSAESGMQALETLQLVNIIRLLKKPVLGICLGMQLLFDFSEEGNVDCLGVIPGRIKKFTQTPNGIMPHMGWNQFHKRKKSALLKNIGEQAYAYFVHSYLTPVSEYTIARTDYGESFSAVVQKDNFFGTQFHPEKSAAIGEKILENFLRL